MKKHVLVISFLTLSLIFGTNWIQIGTAKSGSAEAKEINAEIKLYDGPPQGGWRPMAVKIQQNMQKEVPGLKVSLEPGGGASNVLAANDQRALAMAMGSSAYDGYLGNAPFTKKMDGIRHVMVLFPMFYVIMTTEKSGITSMNDLKGKRVNVQQRGYAAELVNQMILSEYKLTYKDVVPQFLGEGDAVDALKDGHIDVNMAVGVSPYPLLMDLLTLKGAKLLKMSNEVIQNLAKRNRGLVPGKIPAGTYPSIKEDIPTINMPTIMIANKDLSEDMVYEITKGLVNSFKDMQNTFDFLKKWEPEEMATYLGVPFHPGALKYHKERGWIK